MSPRAWCVLWVLVWLWQPHWPAAAQQVVPSIHSTVTIADAAGSWVPYSHISQAATSQASPLLVVVWEAPTVVQGQLLLSSAGVVLGMGSAFNVSDASMSLNSCGGALSAVAPTATGFVVAWSAAPTPTEKCSIFLQYYSVSGLNASPAGPVTLVSRLPGVHLQYPSVASCGDGDVVAWWGSGGAGVQTIWVDSGGWNASFQFATVDSDPRPVVVCLRDDTWAVAHANSGAVAYRVFNRKEAIPGSLSVAQGTTQSRPAMARVSNSSFIVAWDVGLSSTQYRVVDISSGFSGSGTAAGSTDGSSQSFPHVASLDPRTAIVVWTAKTATARIVSVTGAAAPLGPAHNVTAGAATGSMPDVTALGGRFFALTYCAQGVPVVRTGKANSLPVLQFSVVSQTVRAGQPFTFSHPVPLFSDPDGDPITVTATLASGEPLSPWLQYNASVGRFSALYANSTTITVALVANDGFDSVSATFVLMVRSPPLAHPLVNQTVVAGRWLAFAVSDLFSDPDSQFTVSVAVFIAQGNASDVSWITVTDGSVLCSPPRSMPMGDVFVVLTADDSLFNSTISFWLRVTANTPPVVLYPLRLQFGSPQFSRTKQLIFAFSANSFFDADGDPLTYTAQLAGNASLPRWLTFIPDTRTFFGNPDYMDDETVVVTVTASDGLDAVSDSFTIALYYPTSTTTLMVAAVLSVGLVVVIIIGLWFYARRHRVVQTEVTNADGTTPVTVAPRSLAPSLHQPHLERPEYTQITLSPEELELQAYFEQEFPDLIDPISGEVMRDPVVTSAGQSYCRHELLKHLELRCTDPLTNLPLNPEQPFEPNHTLKKVVMAIIQKWQDDRSRAMPLDVPTLGTPTTGLRSPPDLSARSQGPCCDPHVPDPLETQELLKP